jgi:competence protein ComEC
VLTVPPPPLWLVAASVTAWALAWRAPTRGIRVGAVVLWVSALTTILRGPALPDIPDKALRFPPCRAPGAPSQMVKLNVFDVAQGTAVLLRMPHAPPMLVDAGGAGRASRFDVGARIVSPSLWALGVRELGIVVLTHADRDHVGGAPAIVRSFTPREIWEGIAVPNLPLMDEVRTAAERADLAWVSVQRGASRRIGETAVHVRHPPAPEWERRRVRNDDSIVLEARVGQVSIVLPGDIGANVEPDVARLLEPAALRILLAAHHGSRGSSSAAWLHAIDPRVVIVSAGRDNPYGHPAPAVLERVRAHGAAIYRTDVDGAIEVDTDGAEAVVTTCSGRTGRYTGIKEGSQGKGINGNEVEHVHP